jgi:PAS domain S-box-containing protein
MTADTSLWARVSRSTPGRYALAVAITAVGLLARWALDPLLGNVVPYITMYPGIVFLASFVGIGPSILASVLSMLGVIYWFIQPRGSFEIMDPAHTVSYIAFLIVCGCIIAAGEVNRRSRVKVQSTEALFQSFLDNSPGTAYLKDENGRYIYSNRTNAERFKRTFAGHTDSDLFPADCAAEYREHDLMVLKENQPQSFTEHTQEADGQHTWLSVKFPVIDAEGRKLLGGKSFDITEQRRAEDEIRRLQQENARRVAAELEAMTRLQEVANRCVRSEDDFQGSLDAILDAAIFLTGAEKGNLQLLNPAGELAVAAQRGFHEPFLKFFSPIKEQASVSRTAMLAKERVIAEDITKSEIFAGTSSLQVLLDEGVRALQATPLVSSTGKLLGMIVTHFSLPHRPGERALRLMDLLARQAADYLERKQAEEELHTSEERLRLAQMSGNVGVWDWDVKGNQLRWSPELEALYGLEPGTVQTYEDFRKRVNPDDLAMTEAKRDEALGKHQPFDLEFRIVDASGKNRWVIAKGRGFYDDAGQLVRVLGNNIDITERKQAEEEIKAASELLRRFLNAVPTGLTRCSRDLRYLMANPAYAAIAGLPVEQIVGRPIIDVMGAEGWEKIRPYVERVLRGERVEYEMRLPFARGGAHYIHVAYTPERGPSGEVVGWVASVMDITEFKRLEAQLQKVEKLAAAGQLAASLAHEINNPLSTVTNALYLLKVHPDLDDEAMEMVKTAGSELERVARIVKQSLSYYREGTTPKELDLGASVEESLQIYGEKFQRSGVEMRKKIVLKTWMMGFPDEIRQVIDNLLLNALEATPGGGRLAVRVRWSRDWKNQRQGGVRLTIADSGQGIPKEQIAKIFEPFYTTKAERGTGLGLWVVRGIVAKHEATMKFRSSARHNKSGTVVSILWPSSGWREHIEEAARSGSAA